LQSPVTNILKSQFSSPMSLGIRTWPRNEAYRRDPQYCGCHSVLCCMMREFRASWWLHHDRPGSCSSMRFSGTSLAPTCRSVRSERWLQKGATGDWLAGFAKLSWRPTETTRSSAFTQTYRKPSVCRVSSQEKNADNSFEVIYVSK
jgi:hypothetical protein